MLKKQLFKLTTFAILAASTSAVMAHLNIAPEDAISVGDGPRQYKEGTSAFIDVNISHDCSNSEGKHFSTTGVTVLMPNSNSVLNTYSSNEISANAIMSIKQRINKSFKKNIVVKGAVQPFYSHGIKTEDARVLKWLGGKIDNDHYENLEFKASFPKIDPASCIAKIRMYFPSMQYCKKGYKVGWLRTANSKFGMGDAKTRITDTYAAYADVVRTSELPESCGNGEVIEVMPSIDDINKYLGNQTHHDHYSKKD